MSQKTQFQITGIQKYYSKYENFKLVDKKGAGRLCYIYFSSNGIYYPNTETEFKNKIITQERYEWARLYNQRADRTIFVRDIYKQWYIQGINKKLNTPDKLFLKLKKLTKGYQVICVGSSAGGYAAVYFGIKLKSEHIFTFSGQFSLMEIISNKSHHKKNPFVVSLYKKNKNQEYLNLPKLINESDIDIFYFYPAYCPQDLRQNKLIEKFKNVHCFALKDHRHGATCYPVNFKDLFNMSTYQLKALRMTIGDDPISLFIFSLRCSGFFKTFIYLITRALKKLNKSH